MEILAWIIEVLKTVPVWVWVIGAICIIAPTAAYFIKRSAKVILGICIVAAALFVFPSIGQAFMETAGLKYNPETNQLTNRIGQTITIKLPEIDGVTEENAEETVTDLIDKAQKILTKIDKEALKDGAINIEDIKTKGAELFGEYFSDGEAQTIMRILNFAVEEEDE